MAKDEPTNNQGMTRRELERAQRVATFGTNIPNVKQKQSLAQVQGYAAKLKAAQDAGYTLPATGATKEARLELFKSMQQAGRSGAEESERLRAEATNLGISDSGYRRALNKIPATATAPAATAPAATAPAATAPATTGTPSRGALMAASAVTPVGTIGPDKEEAGVVLARMRKEAYDRFLRGEGPEPFGYTPPTETASTSTVPSAPLAVQPAAAPKPMLVGGVRIPQYEGLDAEQLRRIAKR